MVVLRSHSFVFESAGRTFNVQPFSSNLGMAKYFPIVDGALACDCPCTGKVFVLVIMNALHVLSMDHNMIPHFIMRFGGIVVNDVPKIHCEDPMVDDHSVSFDRSSLRILLRLNSMFPYF